MLWIVMDLSHGPQLFFMMIDGFILKERVSLSYQTFFLPLKASLVYFFWNLGWYVIGGVVIYGPLDWNSMKSFYFVLSMLFLLLVGSFMNLLMDKVSGWFWGEDLGSKIKNE
jgi:hypothetical protein